MDCSASSATTRMGRQSVFWQRGWCGQWAMPYMHGDSSTRTTPRRHQSVCARQLQCGPAGLDYEEAMLCGSVVGEAALWCSLLCLIIWTWSRAALAVDHGACPAPLFRTPSRKRASHSEIPIPINTNCLSSHIYNSAPIHKHFSQTIDYSLRN